MDQCKIGRFIASCRKENKMTQVQLAEKLNITDRAVSKWENGRCLPDSSIMIELCELLDITVNELLNGEKVEPGHAQQIAEENLIALKLKDEKETSKSRNLMLTIFVLIFAFLAAFAIYANKSVKERHELEEKQKTLSGMYSTIGDNDVLTDEAKKIVHLITGSSWDTFVFSYQAESTTNRIRLICDTYAQGEKTNTAVLIDHEFVKTKDNSFFMENTNSNYPVIMEEILPDYPRHGYLFVDCNNEVTACTDEYMVESKAYNEDGTVSEDFGRYESVIREQGQFPTMNYTWSYRFHLSKKYKL